jgi:hypothetical protein
LGSVIATGNDGAGERLQHGRWSGDAWFWKVGELFPAVARVVAEGVTEGVSGWRAVFEGEVCSTGDVEPTVVVTGGSEDAAWAWEWWKRGPARFWVI